MPIFSDTLKRLRYSQPFNCIATSLTRAVLRSTGMRSELAIKHLHRVGVVKDRLPNGRVLRLWSRADDWVSNQLYWRGWDGYEPDTSRMLFALAARSGTVLDIGAYVGFYTLLMAHTNPQAQVYAFEPLPAIFRRLQRNIALNEVANVHCANCAVGERDGTAEFFHQGQELPTSSSLSHAFMAGARDLQSTVVEVRAMDSFAAEHGLQGVDLVKIDTETTEPEVLRGMRHILEEHHPSIICEVLEGRGREVEDVLKPLGYRFYLLTAEGPIPEEHILGQRIWLNHFATTMAPSEVAALLPEPGC